MICTGNAATTKMSGVAIHTMTSCMQDTWGNPSSLYELRQKAKGALDDTRERIASCIGASPKEITFASGDSKADTRPSAPPSLSTTPSCTR